MSELFIQAQMVMIYLILCFSAGFLAGLVSVESRRNRILVAIALIGMAGMISWLVTCFFGGKLMYPAMFVGIVMLGMSIYQTVKRTNNRVHVYIFIGCVLAILFVTVFYRIGADLPWIRLNPFYHANLALNGSWEELNHILLNILLFIPLGFSFSYMQKRRIIQGIFTGFLFSALIESTQLVFSMGECDTGDVLSNGSGMLFGMASAAVAKMVLKKR